MVEDNNGSRPSPLVVRQGRDATLATELSKVSFFYACPKKEKPDTFGYAAMAILETIAGISGKG